jgi:hypothetical protein
VAALVDAAEAEPRIRTAGKRARELAAGYDWDDVATGYEKLAQSLARRDFPSRRPSGHRMHPTAPVTLRIPEPRPEPAIEVADSSVIRFPGAQQ